MEKSQEPQKQTPPKKKPEAKTGMKKQPPKGGAHDERQAKKRLPPRSERISQNTHAHTKQSQNGPPLQHAQKEKRHVFLLSLQNDRADRRSIFFFVFFQPSLANVSPINDRGTSRKPRTPTGGGALSAWPATWRWPSPPAQTTRFRTGSRARIPTNCPRG